MKSFISLIEENNKILSKLEDLPQGKIFDDAKDISKIFKKSSLLHNKVLVDFENDEDKAIIKDIDIKDINITQPNITVGKIKKFLKLSGNPSPIPAVKYKDKIVIFDGHHRLVTEWLKGKKTVKVKLVQK